MLHRFRAIAKRKQEQRRERIAYKLWLRRQRLNRPGNQDDDWARAGKIARNPIRMMLFDLNSPLIWMEKTWFEPTDSLLNRSAFFDIVDRLSPALEAIGVLLIPLALYIATQHFEEQRDARELEQLQQEAVEDYIGRVTNVLLNANGDLRSDDNERIRNVLTAATLTQLHDPNLDGRRKGQIIQFLTQARLLQEYESDDENTIESVVSLYSAELSDADLVYGADLRNINLSSTFLIDAAFFGSDLSNANLSGAIARGATFADANLSGANLSGAHLYGSDMNRANFSGANLSFSDLRDANLRLANLKGANLTNAELINADLFRVNFSGADLRATNLNNALLFGTNLVDAKGLYPYQLIGDEHPYLCATKLPPSFTDLDPNRDCDDLPKMLMERYDMPLEEAQKAIEFTKSHPGYW